MIALNGKLNLAVNVVICIRARIVLIYTYIVQSLTYECSIVAHQSDSNVLIERTNDKECY